MRRFGAVTFFSAFLLFLIQPLVARQILPWFGGAQSVWATCLVFYQTLLLVGYLYAHLGRRLGMRRQAILHGALLLASIVLLPVTASPAWKPVGGATPTLPLLGLLATTVGGPYLLLASTAPLLQDWFTRRHPGRSPYPLYAVSNAGSLLALVAYPTLVEPLFGVSRQGVLWSIAFGAFVVILSALAATVARGGPSMKAAASDAPMPISPLPCGVVALWVALAATGSGLLLAVTNHITMDVAVVPFLWVLPLVVYLVTYILGFAGMYRRSTWGGLLVLGLAAMAILWNYGFALPLGVQLGVSVGVLFAACMVCHGELSRAAPAGDRLTTFYLSAAAGGALGGMLVVFVAPVLFDDFWELPGFLLLTPMLLWWILRRERPASAVRGWGARDLAFGFVVVVAALGFVLPTVRRDRGTVAADRNFYGVLRVQDRPEGILSDERVLRVGRIFHGGQFLDSARAREPTAYFTAGSGVAIAIQRHPRRLAGEPLRIGVIGLGVGTIAAWGQPGDSLRYYEINPAVERFARRWFTFLADSRASVDVVLGDGRLSLEREVAGGGARRFDVLVIDAFSGDAVPIHLLTEESADLYERVLADDGVLVFQVTNRHLDLAPVVRGLAARRGMETVQIAYDPPAGSGGSPSVWILVSRNEALLANVRPSATPAGSDRTIDWTDDRSNLLQILR